MQTVSTEGGGEGGGGVKGRRAGEGDNPSKDHKGSRLSFRARTKPVWMSVFFFFFFLTWNFLIYQRINVIRSTGMKRTLSVDQFVFPAAQLSSVHLANV